MLSRRRTAAAIDHIQAHLPLPEPTARERTVGEVLALPDRTHPDRDLRIGEGGDMTDVWVANERGDEIVRARDIAVVSLDYNGNVNVRLAGVDGPVDDRRAPGKSSSAGQRFSSPARPRRRRTVRCGRNLPGAGDADETRGWQWVTESL